MTTLGITLALGGWAAFLALAVYHNLYAHRTDTLLRAAIAIGKGIQKGSVKTMPENAYPDTPGTSEAKLRLHAANPLLRVPPVPGPLTKPISNAKEYPHSASSSPEPDTSSDSLTLSLTVFKSGDGSYHAEGFDHEFPDPRGFVQSTSRSSPNDRLDACVSALCDLHNMAHGRFNPNPGKPE